MGNEIRVGLQLATVYIICTLATAVSRIRAKANVTPADTFERPLDPWKSPAAVAAKKREDGCCNETRPDSFFPLRSGSLVAFPEFGLPPTRTKR
jgi:hypothetical protein